MPEIRRSPVRGPVEAHRCRVGVVDRPADVVVAAHVGDPRRRARRGPELLEGPGGQAHVAAGQHRPRLHHQGVVVGQVADLAVVPTLAAPESADVPGTPLVDLERLRQLTDGTEAGLRELVNLYLEQTTSQLGQLMNAVRDGQTDAVRRLAHSCAGASATCGVRALVPLLRELERQADAGKLTSADALCASAVREFEGLREFLAPYSLPAVELAAHA